MYSLVATQRVQVLQNDAIRAALGLRWSGSVSRARAEFSVLAVSDLIRYRAVTNVYKWSAGMLPASVSLDWSFKPTAVRSLRGTGIRELVVPRDNTVFVQQGPKYTSAVAWNKLPQLLREIVSLYVFKRSTKRYLLGH